MLPWRRCTRIGGSRIIPLQLPLEFKCQYNKFAVKRPRRSYPVGIGPIPTEPVCHDVSQGKIPQRSLVSVILDPNESESVSTTERSNTFSASSLAAMRDPLDTMLYLSGASTNLTVEDFKRILPESKHIPGWRSDGGLLKVIPIRDPVTLDRLNHWLLAFSTPYHAALYHSRLLWYHINARTNTPVHPLEQVLSLNTHVRKTEQPRAFPAAGQIDPTSGEDLWRRVQEYTIFSPHQQPLVRPYLAPFNHQILDNLWWHRQWTKPDSHGRVSYPVMISLEPEQSYFHGATIWEFIKHDSEERGLDWAIYDSDKGIQPVFYATYGSGDPSARIAHDAEAGSLRDKATYGDMPMDRNKWMIRFKDKNEAKRFIRRWDLREFADGQQPGRPPVLKVDQLW